MADTSRPASFEALRGYLQTAVDQLVVDLQAQQVNYVVPGDNVLALLERVGHVQGRGFWDEWESWALRHAIPIHDLIQGPSLGLADIETLRKRLNDVLGYCILGLVACERRAGCVQVEPVDGRTQDRVSERPHRGRPRHVRR